MIGSRRKVLKAFEALRERGFMYEMDDALWFRSSELGDEKDRVVVRSNGQKTYFAGDIAYLIDKRERGFEHAICIWGADHHGTVARVRNAAEAMGSRGKLTVSSGRTRDGKCISIKIRDTGPGIAADANPHGAHVSLVDVMPTLCEAVGIELPGGVQGRSPGWRIRPMPSRR
mgnify:CR=1 FL=1